MLLTEETCDGMCNSPCYSLLSSLFRGLMGRNTTQVNNQACRLKNHTPSSRGIGDAFVSKTCPYFQSITLCWQLSVVDSYWAPERCSHPGHLPGSLSPPAPNLDYQLLMACGRAIPKNCLLRGRQPVARLHFDLLLAPFLEPGDLDIKFHLSSLMLRSPLFVAGCFECGNTELELHNRIVTELCVPFSL